MKTNLAQLEQAEMDKVNVDWRQPGWHLKSATICQLSRRRSNVSSQSTYAPRVSRAADCPSSGFRITIPTPLRTQS